MATFNALLQAGDRLMVGMEPAPRIRVKPLGADPFAGAPSSLVRQIGLDEMGQPIVAPTVDIHALQDVHIAAEMTALTAALAPHPLPAHRAALLQLQAVDLATPRAIPTDTEDDWKMRKCADRDLMHEAMLESPPFAELSATPLAAFYDSPVVRSSEQTWCEPDGMISFGREAGAGPTPGHAVAAVWECVRPHLGHDLMHELFDELHALGATIRVWLSDPNGSLEYAVLNGGPAVRAVNPPLLRLLVYKWIQQFGYLLGGELLWASVGHGNSHNALYFNPGQEGRLYVGRTLGHDQFGNAYAGLAGMAPGQQPFPPGLPGHGDIQIAFAYTNLRWALDMGRPKHR